MTVYIDEPELLALAAAVDAMLRSVCSDDAELRECVPSFFLRRPGS
jgi:hypothetical protein